MDSKRLCMVNKPTILNTFVLHTFLRNSHNNTKEGPLPVESPLHWIEEVTEVFCSLLNETPESGQCWLNGLLPNNSNLYL